jgi:PadR family transcriptional regulator AphA
MPREMKTKYAVLGFLSRGPLSGYDIKRTIDETLGNLWSESYGQLYPILQKLTDDGLVTKTVYRQAGRPDRHTYTITEKGLQTLQTWLSRPSEPHRERIEVLLKLMFGAHAPIAESIQQVERFRGEHQTLLDQYRRVEAQLQQEQSDSPDLPFRLMTVRCGVQMSRALVNWCDDTLAVLNQMAAQKVKAGSRTRRAGGDSG